MSRNKKPILDSTHYLALAILGVALSTCLSCTRQTSDMASINVAQSFQSLAVSDSYTLERIMVNVRGPGIPSVQTYVWSDHNQNGAAAPTIVPMTVPSGPERLIQYLAVYDTPEDVQVFYYGDIVTTLRPGTQNIELTIASSGPAGKETGIAGRYIRADGSFPTGKVRIELTPPNGRPNMIVDRGEIFGGWFSWFVFDNVPFSYILEPSQEVLVNRLTATNITPLAVTPQRVLINVPDHFQYYSGVCSTEMRYARNIVFGYFGEGSVGKKVCSQNAAEQLGIYANSSGTCGAELTWGATWVSEGSAQAGAVRGGYTQTDTSNVPNCTEDLASDEMMFPHSRLKNGGKDSLVTTGPFKISLSTGSSLNFTPDSATQFTMEWEFAPDVALGTYGVVGVEVFKRNSGVSTISARRKAEDEGLNCQEALVKSQYTFVSDQSTSVTSHSFTGSVGSDDHNGDSSFNQGDYHLALCPYAMVNGSKFYFSTMAEHQGQYYSAPAANLSFSTSLLSFTSTPTGYVTEMSVTITNNGTLNATGMAPSGLAAPFSFAGGSAPGTGGTCGTTLTPAGTCTYHLSFSPASAVLYGDTLVLDYHDGNSTQTVTMDLDGLGVTPSFLLTASPSSHHFGPITGGSSLDQIIQITNNGNVAATTGVVTGLAAPFTVISEDCAVGSLAVGASCTVTVRYSPPGSGASDMDDLDVNFSTGHSILVNLTGSSDP